MLLCDITPTHYLTSLNDMTLYKNDSLQKYHIHWHDKQNHLRLPL